MRVVEAARMRIRVRLVNMVGVAVMFVERTSLVVMGGWLLLLLVLAVERERE